MNAFDYFFENSRNLQKLCLVGKENTSYNDLHRLATRLAAYLEKEHGHGKSMLLLSHNNLFFLITYLAIIKSGNTCIPLDPNIEKDNFDYISKLTNPSLVFITKEVERKIDVSSFNCIGPETINDYYHIDPPEGNFGGTDENDCAEIIFTSGSTGKPKGVMISHKNLVANTSSIIEYLKLTEKDRMLVVLPFYYCYGLSLLHTHLRVGGSMVFNNSFIFLGGVFNNLLEYECTGFAGVPSHFQILLRKSETFKKSKFPSLKYVTQAGGKLAPVFIDEFRSSHPETQFIVMYGQTEATARLSYLPPALYDKKKGSMGKGIPGVELRVVNESGEKIKPGEVGEVIAHGDNIMLGYFADDEATKYAIRNGWLYTGDLGTVDEDGFIYLTARKKEIIKVGGKRISPKEVEEVIFSIPEVIDCTVSGIEDEMLGEAIKATVVVDNLKNCTLTERLVQEYCAKRLVSFKIPQKIEFIENITISPTGKKIARNF